MKNIISTHFVETMGRALVGTMGAQDVTRGTASPTDGAQGTHFVGAMRPTWRWVRAAVLAGVLGTLTCAADPAITYDWNFPSGVDPTAPDVAAGGTGTSQALIAPGTFGSGWLATRAGMGSVSGVWDLGRSGSIDLSNPAGIAGDTAVERTIVVSVDQYLDGGIFSQVAPVVITGAQLLSSNVTVISTTTLGAWKRVQTQWKAPAGTPVNSILVNGVVNGTVVDRVTVESSFATLPPPQLSIRSVGANNENVEISWPASYSTMILQSATNAENPIVWANVPDAVQVNGSIRSVTVPAMGTVKLYRLKSP